MNVKKKYHLNVKDEWLNECIDICIERGVIEEMIAGRISLPWILPYILRFCKSHNLNVNQNYISLSHLSSQLQVLYPNMSSHLAIRYLFNIIYKTKHLFIIHDDDNNLLLRNNDTNKHSFDLNDNHLANIRFTLTQQKYISN